jgi:hypothetical protein
MTKAKTKSSAPAKTVAQHVAETPVHSAPELTVGFEKALVMIDPEWRTNLTEAEINRARHFYHQGIQDVYLVVRVGEQRLAQNFQAILGTLVAGSEESIATQRAAHEQDLSDVALNDGDPTGDVERGAVGLPPPKKISKPATAKARKDAEAKEREFIRSRWNAKAKTAPY